MRPARANYLALGACRSLLMLAGLVMNVEAADTKRGDEMLAAYFRHETQQLADACSAKLTSADDWTNHRQMYQRQLREMLGLDPLSERTPLEAVVTGKLERDDFLVEKLYFQSRPHLYVTGNLYLPKNITGPSPAILYVCGHSTVKKNGIAFGSKVAYQKHGAWLARNGYVCLVIDTLQLGEIEGIHHGTYREGMWWWNARGYTPAGVETWNAMRAIDYLVSRPEVDANRIGITGRSGGGAYSWYVTALDDRVKAAVPVAGITTLKNHVVDGCVSRHCDCMYFINTYRWDFPQVAALAAPRPLLISNTDRDELFPLDGVVDLYGKVRRLYEYAGRRPDVALQIAAGPHADGQVLQLHALEWFNQHFKGENPLVETAAKDFFTPEELKVFDKLPADQINTRIHETFVPAAPPPSTVIEKLEWESERDRLIHTLREKCFGGWPATDDFAKVAMRPQLEAELGSVRLTAYDFESQHDVTLRLYLLAPKDVPVSALKSIELQPLDDGGWSQFVAAMKPEFAAQFADEPTPPTASKHSQSPQSRVTSEHGLAFVAPRGIGPTAWTNDPTARIHIRRRFMLLGQTLGGMRVWDVRRAIQTLRAIDGLADVPLSLRGDREMAGIALYAALFEPKIERLALRHLSRSHSTGPDFLNVLRFLDVPQMVAMVTQSSRIELWQDGNDAWEYPLAIADKFGWGDRIKIKNDGTR